jgi:TMEM175 potassium channel family protein
VTGDGLQEQESTSTAGDDQSAGHAVGWADPSRAIAFSDGVLAIIITLLVLDLRPPDGEPGQLLTGLLNQWPTYLAYLASYLYVGVVWTNHKAVFRHIRSMDTGLHWVNLAVLFTTGLLPFPTAVMAKAIGAGNLADEQTAVGLYALIGTLLCLSWLLFFHYLSRHPEALQHEDDDRFFASERLRAVVGAGLYAIAGVMGYLVAPGLALAIFIALPIFYAITSEGLDRLPLWKHRS